MFGFKNTTYRQFNKNFLKTVVFQISFSKIDSFNSKKSEIIAKFNTVFPKVRIPDGGEIEISFNNKETPIVQHVKNDGTIEMKSETGQKVLIISNTSLSLTISGREYKNYSELKALIINIEEFFNFCDISEVSRIAIRKINIIEFNLFENTKSIDILRSIINENLVSDINSLPKSEFIKQNMHLLSLNNGEYNLNLKYGLNVPNNPSQNIAQIIIDIDLFSNIVTPIEALFNKSDKINFEIFNAFNWTISETFLNLLND